MGGAVTNLAAVKHGLARYDPDIVQGTVLDRTEIDRQIELYRTRSADERRQIVGLQPQRADIILAGACIVRTVLASSERTRSRSAIAVCDMVSSWRDSVRRATTTGHDRSALDPAGIHGSARSGYGQVALANAACHLRCVRGSIRSTRKVSQASRSTSHATRYQRRRSLATRYGSTKRRLTAPECVW